MLPKNITISLPDSPHIPHCAQLQMTSKRAGVLSVETTHRISLIFAGSDFISRSICKCCMNQLYSFDIEWIYASSDQPFLEQIASALNAVSSNSVQETTTIHDFSFSCTKVRLSCRSTRFGWRICTKIWQTQAVKQQWTLASPTPGSQSNAATCTFTASRDKSKQSSGRLESSQPALGP